MGEIMDAVIKIKEGEKDKFLVIIRRLKPLISKYTKKLYKDEREDTESEFILALWEAIIQLKYVDNDARLMVYLNRCIYIKFLELYRSSCKIHNNEVGTEIDVEGSFIEDKYEEILQGEDIKSILKKFSGKKLIILKSILFGNLTDMQISQKYGVSRQYVNRIRRQVRERFRIYIN